MNTTSRGAKGSNLFFIFAAAVAATVACSRADASRGAAQSAPPAMATGPAETALEIAGRDCAGSVTSGRSGQGGDLADVRAVALERVPVHSGAIGHASSAWRLAVASRRGAGAIVLVELPGGDCYLGQGLFLGWTQEQLGSAYGMLKPRPDPVPDDFQQLD